MSKSLHGKRSEKVNNNKADAVENVADLETYAAALGLSACDLAAFGLRDVITPKGAAVEIPYRRRDGTDVRKRIWRAPKGASAEWDEHEQAGTCLYGLDHIPSRGQTLFLVTGEAGCHILWHYGLDAIGVSSAYDFVPSRDDPELEDYAIIALLEPDEDGDALVERLSLSRLRQDVRVVRLDGFANIAEAQTQHADIIVLVDRARRASEPLTVFLDDHPRLDKQKYPDRVEITLKAGERPRVADETIAVIQKSGALYERGGELVRLCKDLVVPVEEHWLADYLGRHIAFYRCSLGKDGEPVRYVTDAPAWLCKVITRKRGCASFSKSMPLAKGGGPSQFSRKNDAILRNLSGLKDLAGIITAPTLRPDGSLLHRPGFDDATGLLLRPGKWPHIPQNPVRDELLAAWNVLWEPVAEFPYASNEDRGVTAAALLTATVRRTLPRAPAFSFDAPTPSSGKTLLATCVAELAGGEVAVVPECRDEEELRKRLLSALREGQPSILLDNIKGQFASSALEAYLTDDYYADRMLGASQMLRLRTNILTLVSGNNFIPRGDLWRRIVTARIDPRVEHAERRSFKFDARKHCREFRQSLVAAALTLLRGFVAAGWPRTTSDRLGSFELWDDMVRQCVLWLNKEGIAELGDPTVSIGKAKEMEPERQKLNSFLEAVRAVMGAGEAGQRWRTADLMQRAEGMLHDNERELRDVLREIAGERNTINSRVLGRWIERQVDIRCGGLFVERAGSMNRAILWRIQDVSETTAQGDAQETHRSAE